MKYQIKLKNIKDQKNTINVGVIHVSFMLLADGCKLFKV